MQWSELGFKNVLFQVKADSLSEGAGLQVGFANFPSCKYDDFLPCEYDDFLLCKYDDFLPCEYDDFLLCKYDDFLPCEYHDFLLCEYGDFLPCEYHDFLPCEYHDFPPYMWWKLSFENPSEYLYLNHIIKRISIKYHISVSSEVASNI